jgi:hypothetical protein
MFDAIGNYLMNTAGPGLASLILALIILVVGYILARLIAGIIRRLLGRTNLDNRLADALSQPDERREYNVEDIVGKIVFWLLFLFVLVAFFQTLGMVGIAAPIQSFLDNLTTNYLPRLLAAGILLFIAWLVALALRFLVSKSASLLKLDERLSKYGALEEGEQVSFGESLSIAVFWFVFLLFLPAVLDALGISAIADPIKEVFAEIFAYIPQILAALVVFLVGWFIARIVRQVVTNLLVAIGTDKFGQRLGIPADRSLSNIIGTLTYIVLLIVTLITAFETLDIAAISVPTVQMLSTIINVIPNLLGAALVLIVAYAIARLVADLVRDFLTTIGFDSVPEKLGVKWSATTSPSQWVAYLLILAIMLFAAIAAFELLGSSALVVALNVFIAFFWRVVLAVVIFAIGLYFANMAYKTVVSSGANQANFVGRAAQVAIVIFAAAIALREVGVANEIISLAFGILLFAVGLAVALAFGLGSKEIAGRELDNFLTVMRGSKGQEDQE